MDNATLLIIIIVLVILAFGGGWRYGPRTLVLDEVGRKFLQP
jgi:hypothetical protein